MSAITNLYAGVPITDLDASIDWYTRFFGKPPDFRAGEEVLWEIDERAWLFIEPNAARAGTGRITLSVTGLDALLERLATQRLEHGHCCPRGTALGSPATHGTRARDDLGGAPMGASDTPPLPGECERQGGSDRGARASSGASVGRLTRQRSLERAKGGVRRW